MTRSSYARPQAGVAAVLGPLGFSSVPCGSIFLSSLSLVLGMAPKALCVAGKCPAWASPLGISSVILRGSVLFSSPGSGGPRESAAHAVCLS